MRWPHWCFTDAVVRLIPGVLGAMPEARHRIRFPQVFSIIRTIRGRKISTAGVVPEVLLSGNHAAIETWRRKHALEVTEQSAVRI